MGFLTTQKNERLRDKGNRHAASKWSGKGGDVCDGCGKPLASRGGRSNYHPKCAKNAVKGW
ncbi:hypothetical protein [Sciscionella marina]|uniref:hypothetical protein n=1 Tax=Sciscionella marina TaxID=508770 RepID=UPI00037627CF|nr:hypothetical protein [Sciscionella marina]